MVSELPPGLFRNNEYDVKKYSPSYIATLSTKLRLTSTVELQASSG